MSRYAPRTLGLVALGLLLGGCSSTNRVLFVTSSTIGMDVDSKPSTASIGYERIEGYVGPRYQAGAVPAVMASIATGGNVFAPKIAQVYATGAAAQYALDTAAPPSAPAVLDGKTDWKHLVFFGTTTTLGFHIGFTGSVPDSATLGYKRKEFAVLPLSSPSGANRGDALPSVLASINTAVTSGSLNGVGLTAQQFFATGTAAEALAATPAIRQEFAQVSQDAVASTLTEAQRQQAQQKANQQRSQLATRLSAIIQYVAPGGTVDAKKLSALVDKANAAAARGTPVPDSLKQESTVDGIKETLSDQQAAVKHLYDALPPHPDDGGNQ